MFTAFVLTLVLIALGVSFLGVILVGLLKLAFKLIGLALGFVFVFAGGAVMLAVGLGIGVALLVPVLPLLALIALIWLIARGTQPAPAPTLTYAPRH